VIPVCPHKSLLTFQVKIPLDVKELYQLTNIACSSGCRTPIQKKKEKKKKRKKSIQKINNKEKNKENKNI